jgi:predicted component of type VI protein secretion system
MNIITSKTCDLNITTNRNRVKTYGSIVYLKDGQKFEIELHNPHTYKVLAKIKLNGYYISSSGLILNPGQRVFLERFLDKDESFIFSTYDVDNTAESKAAIALNGDVEVEYYSQQMFNTLSNTGGNWWNGQTYTYFNSPTTNFYSSTISSHIADSSQVSFSTNACESIETGMIEGGKETGQSLSFSNDQFNSWAFETRKLKILPVSAKPVEVSEIRNYCTNCGTRAKKATWKFCPSCGTKI